MKTYSDILAGKQPEPGMRSQAELELAAQELSDLFYPRRTWGCDECGCSDFHAAVCPMGKTTFQGWQTSVSRYLAPQGECGKKGCDKPAEMRIRLNIWGGLYELDVCREHGTFPDGRSRDGIWCDGL